MLFPVPDRTLTCLVPAVTGSLGSRSKHLGMGKEAHERIARCLRRYNGQVTVEERAARVRTTGLSTEARRPSTRTTVDLGC